MNLIPTFRVQDYSWDDHAYSLINRLYNDVGNLLDDKFRLMYQLTYNTMGSKKDVDTSRFRTAIWNYIQCMFGIRHDDYDYGEVNQVLERSLKAYIKMTVCFPERVTRSDYDSVLKEFHHSEKVKIRPTTTTPPFKYLIAFVICFRFTLTWCYSKHEFRLNFSTLCVPSCVIWFDETCFNLFIGHPNPLFPFIKQTKHRVRYHLSNLFFTKKKVSPLLLRAHTKPFKTFFFFLTRSLGKKLNFYFPGPFFYYLKENPKIAG